MRDKRDAQCVCKIILVVIDILTLNSTNQSRVIFSNEKYNNEKSHDEVYLYIHVFFSQHLRKGRSKSRLDTSKNISIYYIQFAITITIIIRL